MSGANRGRQRSNDKAATLVRCEVSGRFSYLPNGEESGEPLASLWPMSPCGRLGPVFQAPLFRLDGILGRACA